MARALACSYRTTLWTASSHVVGGSSSIRTGIVLRKSPAAHFGTGIAGAPVGDEAGRYVSLTREPLQGEVMGGEQDRFHRHPGRGSQFGSRILQRLGHQDGQFWFRGPRWITGAGRLERRRAGSGCRTSPELSSSRIFESFGHQTNMICQNRGRVRLIVHR